MNSINEFLAILALIVCIIAQISPVVGRNIADRAINTTNAAAAAAAKPVEEGEGEEGQEVVAEDVAHQMNGEMSQQNILDDVEREILDLPDEMVPEDGEESTTEAPKKSDMKVITYYYPTYVKDGEPTTPEKYPRLVAIFNNRTGGERYGKLICGGVSITNRHILTAAHCVLNKVPRDLYVQLSKSIHDNGMVESVKKYEVDSIDWHDMYDTTTYESDIAILRLKGTIKFEYNEHTVRLPDENHTSLVGVNATVAGFGSTGDGQIDPTPTLREAIVPIWNNTDCSIKYEGRSMPDSVVCAGFDKPGADACHGDSGGPLVVKETNSSSILVGVISYGVNCGTSHPGVYTRVSSYLDWIEKMIAE